MMFIFSPDLCLPEIIHSLPPLVGFSEHRELVASLRRGLHMHEAKMDTFLLCGSQIALHSIYIMNQTIRLFLWLHYILSWDHGCISLKLQKEKVKMKNLWEMAATL